MISDAEIAAARAVPIADVVGALVALKRDWAPCPFHSPDKTPSFHVNRKLNIFKCFGCGAGGGPIKFVQLANRLTFPNAVRELLGGWQPEGIRTWPLLGDARAEPCTRGRRTGGPLLPGSGKFTEASDTARIVQLWEAATAPRLAEWYLWSRGIGQKALPSALRGHPRVWCKEAGRFRPAMVAAITGPDGGITAIQFTWLEERLVYDGTNEFLKGARCTDLKAPKKTRGRMGAGSVKLAAARDILGLAESVEDSLAVAKLFRIPCWSTCGTARLGDIQLPDCVQTIVIFADGDEPGRAAAAKAETAYRRRGYQVQSEFPASGAKDFAEMLA